MLWLVVPDGVVHAQQAAPQTLPAMPGSQPEAGGEADDGPRVSKVDARTGRPVARPGDAPDIVDDSSPGQQVRSRIVPAYIALPPVSSAGISQIAGRGGDRGLAGRRLPGETVKERRRPEYDAVGLRTGGIRILPYAMGGIGYDSNVYAEADGRNDVIFTGTAGFTARSEWGRHAIDLEANVRRREYGRFDSENATTYKIEGEGRLDLAGQNNLTARFLQQKIVLDRGVVDDVVTQALPTSYRQTVGEVGGHVEYGPLAVDLTGNIGRQVYADNFSVSGMPVDQRFRNFDSLGGELLVATEISGLRSLYAEVDFERRRFDIVAGGISRDADIFKFFGGMRGGLTRVIRGHLGIGYMLVDFKQAHVDSLRAVAVDADLDWLVTRLTTISLSATRNVRTVAQANARGTLLTVVQLGVDHEVRRNVILSMSLQQQWTDYIADTRRARATGITVGATWLFDRHLQMRPQMSYLERTDRGFGINASPKDFFAGIDLTYKF